MLTHCANRVTLEASKCGPGGWRIEKGHILEKKFCLWTLGDYGCIFVFMIA